MAMLSDEALFVQIKQHSTVAFNELYNRYWLVLFRSAYKRLQDKDACCDILQDTLPLGTCFAHHHFELI